MLTHTSRFHSVVFTTLLTLSGSVNAQWVTTIAGKAGGYQDGIGDSASFYYPINVELDGKGNLYVADWNNDRIRKINLSTREVTTIAGSSRGFKDTIGIHAKFNRPDGLVYDKNGNNLFVVDEGNSLIRKIDLSNNKVTTFAGSTAGYADGIGTNAKFRAPRDIDFDANGNLYVTDRSNNRIRKIDTATRFVSTFAGSGTNGDSDGIGQNAEFWFPAGLVYHDNKLYVAGHYNHRIRRISLSNAQVTTIAGSSAGHRDDVGTSAKFHSPYGIAVDGHGNLFVSDHSSNYIRKINISTKAVTTIAGNGQMGYIDDTTALNASFNEQRGLVVDEKGNIYIADWRNHRIRKLTCGSADVSITTSSKEVCPGDMVQLTANGAQFYQWSNGLGTDSVVTVVPASDTTYYVSGVDSLNCTAVDSIMITMKEVPDKPIISMFNSTLIISSIDTTIEAYQWLDCDNGMAPIPNATHSVFTPGTTGSFAVQVMRDSCTNTSDCFTLTAVQKLNKNSQIDVFPNPSNGNFSIQTSFTAGTISMFNELGKTVYSGTIPVSGKLDISLCDKISGGMYVVSIANQDNRYYRKIIVKDTE